jgi:Protein of unknown function (DUF3108)
MKSGIVRRMRQSAAVIALGIVSASSLTASPAWEAILTPAKLGPQPRLAPCRLDYKASWKGLLDAGEIHLEFGNPAHAKSGCYVVNSTGKSLGAAASLYTYSHWFWSELDPSTLRPRLFHTVEDLDDRRVTHSVNYTSSSVSCTQTTLISASGLNYSNTRKSAYAPVYDIFSAMLFVRSQTLDDGVTLAFVVQPGETPHLVKTYVEGREVHDGHNAIRMDISMQKIDPSTLTLLPYKKLTKATLWLSDDKDRIPLEIRAEVFVGDVRIVLTGMNRY